ALMTITWSPVSTCGVKIGLCLPRSTIATCEAKCPSVFPFASTTYHLRVMSAFLAEYVLVMRLPRVVLDRAADLFGAQHLQPGVDVFRSQTVQDFLRDVYRTAGPQGQRDRVARPG